LTQKEKAILAAQGLQSKKGGDVCLLAVEHVTVLAEYFLLATAKNMPQMYAMLDAVEDAMAPLGETARFNPAPRDSAWRILDYGWLVVHVFLPEQRDYYNLERLWCDGQNQVPLPEVEEGAKA